MNLIDTVPKLKQFIQNVTEQGLEILMLQEYSDEIDLKITQQSIELTEVLQFYTCNDLQEFTKMHSSRSWTDDEWKTLLYITLTFCRMSVKSPVTLTLLDWDEVSTILAIKTAANCHFKWDIQLKNQTTKPWCAEEDQMLMTLLAKENNVKWFEVQYEMHIRSQGRFFRKAKQFRERWNNYLNPNVNRGIWTEGDDYTLLTIAISEGLRWSQIAKKMKNRTENQVKNRFKSLINKEKKLIQVSEQKHIFDQFQQLKNQSPLQQTGFQISPVLQNSQQQSSYSPQLDLGENESKLGIDPQTELLINSMIQRLKPKEQHQFTHQQQTQQQQQYIPCPQIPLTTQFHQPFPLMQPMPIIYPPQTQYFNNQFQPFIAPSPQQFYQQTQVPFLNPAAFAQQLIIQRHQQMQNQFYASQQNSPVSSIGSLNSSQHDRVKEEVSSSSSGKLAREPLPYKKISVSQQISARSSNAGSTSSHNSVDVLKNNMNNMDLNDNNEAESPGKKHRRSQSGADLLAKGKQKIKRSRFYYQSNES